MKEGFGSEPQRSRQKRNQRRRKAGHESWNNYVCVKQKIKAKERVGFTIKCVTQARTFRKINTHRSLCIDNSISYREQNMNEKQYGSQ